ncbi:MAG: metallophosphoesterase family protein [Bacteroidales bacterium]|nr:metallophosphoesterase family protein [Candidatus Colimorpha onthohippi]
MKRIGVLSDTHGVIPPQVYNFFKDCDELWHAGDCGVGVLRTLREFKPVRAVYGNCDGADVRYAEPQTDLFECEGHKVLLTHIGGHPGHYQPMLLPILQREHPDIMVCGHSHILRVMHDKQYDMLYINPGAAGRQGFHLVATLVRFTIDDEPKDMEIMEFDKLGVANDAAV